LKTLYALLLLVILSTFGQARHLAVIKYTIKHGDKFHTIAQKYHTSVQSIININHIKKGMIFRPGNTLYVPIDLYAHLKKNTSNHTQDNTNLKIINLAKRHLGKRYVWGAVGTHSFDCSGLTMYVCKQNGISLPRRAIWQSKVGKYVSRKNLKKGDLIFFDTSKRRKGYVNHVGIYIGNNQFIHASSAKKKVVITNLNKKFYSQRFKLARRVTL